MDDFFADESDVQNDMALAGVALGGILDYCFRATNKGERRNVMIAYRRFVAVSYLIRPDLLDHSTMEEIGADMGLTRAAISKAVRRAGDSFGLRNRLMSKESDRAAMSKARLASIKKARAGI